MKIFVLQKALQSFFHLKILILLVNMLFVKNVAKNLHLESHIKLMWVLKFVLDPTMDQILFI